MKKRNWIISALMLTVFVSGCGQSSEEKEEIAIVTCNVMAETRNMDAAIRVREINTAREKIGEERFLLTDDTIKASFVLGLCKELVLNDPNYSTLLSAALKLHLEAIKESEAKREAAQKKLEAKREAAEKKLEAKREAAQKKWRKALNAELQKRNYKPTLNPIYSPSGNRFDVNHVCTKIDGFKYKLKVVLKNNLGTLRSLSTNNCFGGKQDTFFILTDKNRIARRALSKASDPNSLIERMYIEIYGIYTLGASKFESYNLYKQLSSKSFPPLESYAVLDNPIVYEGKIGD